jgi:ornithine decarboxylase
MGLCRHAPGGGAGPRHRRPRVFADRAGAAAQGPPALHQWTGKITLPARFIPDPAIRTRNGDRENIVPFKVCGATCDSVDILSRPFWLPETVDTGDWIEIGHIGAYSLSLRTRFNGFYPDDFVEVATPFLEGGAPEGFASLETMASD